jgi:hypothetical protein
MAAKGGPPRARASAAGFHSPPINPIMHSDGLVQVQKNGFLFFSFAARKFCGLSEQCKFIRGVRAAYRWDGGYVGIIARARRHPPPLPDKSIRVFWTHAHASRCTCAPAAWPSPTHRLENVSRSRVPRCRSIYINPSTARGHQARQPQVAAGPANDWKLCLSVFHASRRVCVIT